MKSTANRSTIFLVALSMVGCGKDPNIGQSAAHESRIKDGQVVLVRSGKQYGAFVLRNQRMVGMSGRERTDYTWFYRSDGLGTLGTNDPAVSFGIQSNAQLIALGPFKVPWSIHSNGCGFVYYSLLPKQKETPAFELCVTTEKDVQGIDARDSRWRFRERPAFSVAAYVRENIPDALRELSRMAAGDRPSIPPGQNQP